MASQQRRIVMCVAAAAICNELNDGKSPDCTRGQQAGGHEEGGL